MAMTVASSQDDLISAYSDWFLFSTSFFSFTLQGHPESPYHWHHTLIL